MPLLRRPHAATSYAKTFATLTSLSSLGQAVLSDSTLAK